MIKFKQGDKVILKTGGPVMTVAYVTQSGEYLGPTDGNVTCRWFDGEHHRKESFSPAELEAVEDLPAGEEEKKKNPMGFAPPDEQ